MKKELLINYLTNSLMMSNPLIQDDPAYLQLQDDIPSIIDMAMYSLGYGNTEDLSEEELYIVQLKSQHIIYLRLATSVAPEFDVSAEQVSFKKGDRFYHYTALAEKVQDLLNVHLNQITSVGVVRVASKNGTRLNYNLSQTQSTNLSVDYVTSRSAELSWKMYNLTYGEFLKYVLIYSKEPIYDEYSEEMLATRNSKVIEFNDIKRTKYRLNNLEPNTRYYVVIVFYNRDLGKSIQQVEIETGDIDDCQC